MLSTDITDVLCLGSVIAVNKSNKLINIWRFVDFICFSIKGKWGDYKMLFFNDTMTMGNLEEKLTKNIKLNAFAAL